MPRNEGDLGVSYTFVHMLVPVFVVQQGLGFGEAAFQSGALFDRL